MKKYFLTGLAILLPLAVTIAVVVFVLNFLTKPFTGIVTNFLPSIGFHTGSKAVRYAAQIIILMGVAGFTILLGSVTRWFFFRSILNYSDKLLHKIPLVNKVYKTTQDIIQTLFSADKNSFKQVVMAPFPNKDTYSLGLVSRESPKTCEKAKGSELVSVFVPTTPNPTTGFLLMFKKEDLIYLEMRTEDAIKYIVSCGVIVPDSPEPPKE